MIGSQGIGKPAGRSRRSHAPRARGAMRSAARDSGIHPVGEVGWGTHICMFYETKEDLLDASVTYLRAGLQSNEYCVWAISNPITEDDARNAMHDRIPEFERYEDAGSIELIPGRNWYLKGDEFDLQRITGGWNAKLDHALERGNDGLRIEGNAFWLESNHWKEFCDYEQELDRSIADKPIVVLCTYALGASRAVDVLDVVRAHQFTIARRKGEWEFMATPELDQARNEIGRLKNAVGILSNSFAGDGLLTHRERTVLAQIVRGASSREGGRALGISPRTVEFHRANIMDKLGARNVADLVRIVLGE